MGTEVTRKADNEWSLRNDMIVLMAISGAYTQQQIADHFGISRGTVSNIVNDPRGRTVIESARKAVRDKIFGAVEDQLDSLAPIAVRALSKTLGADIHPMHKAKPNQDRVAIRLLEGRGHLGKEPTQDDSGAVMNPEQFDRLVKALEKSQKTRDIDPFEPFERIEEAEAEVVEV